MPVVERSPRYKFSKLVSVPASLLFTNTVQSWEQHRHELFSHSWHEMSIMEMILEDEAARHQRSCVRPCQQPTAFSSAETSIRVSHMLWLELTLSELGTDWQACSRKSPILCSETSTQATDQCSLTSLILNPFTFPCA